MSYSTLLARDEEGEGEERGDGEEEMGEERGSIGIA